MLRPPKRSSKLVHLRWGDTLILPSKLNLDENHLFSEQIEFDMEIRDSLFTFKFWLIVFFQMISWNFQFFPLFSLFFVFDLFFFSFLIFFFFLVYFFRHFRAFCEYGLTATYLGVDCVLIVHIATSFAKVISHEFNVDWDIRFYIAMALVPCLILAEIRQLKYLVPFSAIANLFLGIVFCITAYYIFTGPMEIEKRPLFTSWTDLPLFFR